MASAAVMRWRSTRNSEVINPPALSSGCSNRGRTSSASSRPSNTTCAFSGWMSPNRSAASSGAISSTMRMTVSVARPSTSSAASSSANSSRISAESAGSRVGKSAIWCWSSNSAKRSAWSGGRKASMMAAASPRSSFSRAARRCANTVSRTGVCIETPPRVNPLGGGDQRGYKLPAREPDYMTDRQKVRHASFST